MKKKAIGFLLIVTLLFSTMSVMAAYDDVSYGEIYGQTCTGTLDFGNPASTAKSMCPTISLYCKRASVSIKYYRGSAGPYYAGDSQTLNNSSSAVYATKSLASGNTPDSASGSHYFEHSNGYVTILDTYF